MQIHIIFARAGRRSARHVRWRLRLQRREPLDISISGTILAIGAISLAVKQLNLGIDLTSGAKVTASLAKPASVDDVRNALEKANISNASSAEVQSVTNDKLGPNAVEIQEKIPDTAGQREGKSALDDAFGLRGGEQGFQSTTVGPTFGAQVARSAVIAIIFSLLVIGLCRDPFRGQVRDPGDHRAAPRHPDDRGGLFADRPGGDERNGSGLPDHPRLLDVRHRDRLRPDS